jgi:hypothetical protein
MATGTTLKSVFVVRIFNDTSGLTFLPPHEWAAKSLAELDGFWTCDLLKPPLIVPFESAHEFASGTSAQVTTAEIAFKAATPNCKKVLEYADNRVGYGGHIALYS